MGFSSVNFPVNHCDKSGRLTSEHFYDLRKYGSNMQMSHELQGAEGWNLVKLVKALNLIATCDTLD